MAAMLASLEVGDYVLTTAGFYGVVIDINDDTVIVEFGSNKNCRIPMQKRSVVEVEKPMEEEAKAKAEEAERNAPVDPVTDGVISDSDFDDIMKILKRTRRS